MRHCPLEDSNSDVLKDLARWVRRSTKERANGKQSSPRREDYSPGRRKGLHWLAQIRTFAISQREEFSLCTSKFESDMPGQPVRSPPRHFRGCENLRHFRGLGPVTRVSDAQKGVSWSQTGTFWAPVSDRVFPISVFD